MASPPIQALTTGTVSTFMDALFNFNSTKINTDSFIRQLKSELVSNLVS